MEFATGPRVTPEYLRSMAKSFPFDRVPADALRDAALEIERLNRVISDGKSQLEEAEEIIERKHAMYESAHRGFHEYRAYAVTATEAALRIVTVFRGFQSDIEAGRNDNGSLGPKDPLSWESMALVGSDLIADAIFALGAALAKNPMPQPGSDAAMVSGNADAKGFDSPAGPICHETRQYEARCARVLARVRTDINACGEVQSDTMDAIDELLPTAGTLHQSGKKPECGCRARLAQTLDGLKAKACERGDSVPIISTDPSNSIDAFYYLIQQIEKCGASPDLTEAVVMAMAVRDRLRKSYTVLMKAVDQGAEECVHQVCNVPEGWKLVPVELTPEMRTAYKGALKALIESRDQHGMDERWVRKARGWMVREEHKVEARWKAMIAAAPDYEFVAGREVLPLHLREDTPPSGTCSVCSRKSWGALVIGSPCLMPQPNGTKCAGVFLAIGKKP